MEELLDSAVDFALDAVSPFPVGTAIRVGGQAVMHVNRQLSAHAQNKEDRELLQGHATKLRDLLQRPDVQSLAKTHEAVREALELLEGVLRGWDGYCADHMRRDLKNWFDKRARAGGITRELERFARRFNEAESRLQTVLALIRQGQQGQQQGAAGQPLFSPGVVLVIIVLLVAALVDLALTTRT